jgi:lipoprotein NlpD
LPGIENYGKPGYYAVRPGDTLRRIATEAGQTWQNIAKWNNIEKNPDRLEVGQVLRVIPPAGTAAQAPSPASGATPSTPPAPPPLAPNETNGTANGTTDPSAQVAALPPSAPPSPSSPPSPSREDNLGWIWPAQGSLVASFDEAKNKGININGKSGDSVLAAADGRVVYAGAGLKGYGNLIILQHNNTYLTAYAHNRSLLVKEDQSVQKGQKIAEMGDSDSDRVMLHFEIRRQGKPVDPIQYLPSR